MQFNQKLITPKMAKELLSKNTRNRRPKSPRIARYTNDMLNGRWKEETGECIKISKSGVILDGQNRLYAIVKSGVSLRFVIVSDLAEDIIDVIDSGSPRSSSDSFKILGVKNDTVLPRIIQLYFLLKKGNYANTQVDLRLGTTELLEEYNSREKFWDTMATDSMRYYHSFAKILPPSFLGALLANVLEIDPEKGRKFMDEFTSGESVTNSVIILLRKKLIEDKVSMRKMPFSTRVGLVVKSWNIYRNREKVTLLKYAPGVQSTPLLY